MKAEPAPAAKAPLAPPQSPRTAPADEQSVKRFKALVERDPKAEGSADAEPKAMPFDRPSRHREDLSDQGGNPFGEKAKPLAAPASEAPVAKSDAGDRIAELQKASELVLGLDRAHARPTATQLLLPGGGAIAGGTIVPGAAPGTMDIALHPGSQLVLADSIEALRRRLAARGLTVGQLRIAAAEEQEAKES